MTITTAEHPWDHAMTCPIDDKTEYHDLKTVQRELLQHLEHLPHDFTLDMEQLDHQIQTVADRLKLVSRFIVYASRPSPVQ
jgi:hypothetical protein